MGTLQFSPDFQFIINRRKLITKTRISKSDNYAEEKTSLKEFPESRSLIEKLERTFRSQASNNSVHENMQKLE